MKKFSNIQEVKINQNNPIIKEDLLTIIESCLNVKVNGSIDTYLSKKIDIDGKDRLVEKLTDIMIEKEREVLERVRYQGFSIVEQQLFEKQTAGQLKKHKERVRDLLKKDDFETHTQRQADKIKDGEKAYYRAMAAEQMVATRPKMKKQLMKIHDIFLFRSKQLGYKK
jgi:hypothetical protein